MSRWFDILRAVLFAAMIASLVGVYTLVAGPAIPKFRLVSTRYLLIPLMVISGVLSFPVYAALCRQRSRSGQVRTLYAGLVLTGLLYGVFLWLTGSDGHPAHVLLALLAAHFYGLPLLLALLPVHFALVRLSFYGGADGAQCGPS